VLPSCSFMSTATVVSHRSSVGTSCRTIAMRFGRATTPMRRQRPPVSLMRATLAKSSTQPAYAQDNRRRQANKRDSCKQIMASRPFTSGKGIAANVTLRCIGDIHRSALRIRALQLRRHRRTSQFSAAPVAYWRTTSRSHIYIADVRISIGCLSSHRENRLNRIIPANIGHWPRAAARLSQKVHRLILWAAQRL